MASRLELQTLLEGLIGNRNVYFQPPSTLKMKYPAIRYELNSIDNIHADNAVYAQNNSYKITLIDTDPDSEYVSELSKLPKCRFVTAYPSDGLNHWVFNLYF